jgi:hypothetical protein
LIQTREGPQLLLSVGNEMRTSNVEGGSALGLNVADGSVLWRVRTPEELFTVPMLLRVPDGEEPVYVFAGRNAAMVAVEPMTGRERWRFSPVGAAAREEKLFNFYGGFSVYDQTGDGVGEIVVPNGGDHLLPPDAQDRDPSTLMVVNGATGALVRRFRVVDGKETYCTMTLWRRPEDTLVVYGTGGETVSGSLYGVSLRDFLRGQIGNSRVLVSSNSGHGMIGPPSYADLDGDQIDDLIVTPYDGRVVVLSGRTLEPLWVHQPTTEMETHGSVALSDVDGDGDLDVFANVMFGTFPAWEGRMLRVFNGLDGAVVAEHRSMAKFVMASGLAADVDNDGRDEILFADVAFGRIGQAPPTTVFRVWHVDEQRFDDVYSASGMSGSTGWVGDADGDDKLEWYVALNGFETAGLVRINFAGTAPGGVAWGGYLGTRHDGRY